jgi:hypothetical protein
MNKIIMIGVSTVAASGLFMAAPALATSGSDKDHKIGICHATGSKTNPYVYINVDEHAAAAHARHQDGRDIIGVKSAKDCPKTAVSTPAPTPKATPKPGQVLGSSTENDEQPTKLPDTGAAAGLSALIGVPALAVTGRAYLRSRASR